MVFVDRSALLPSSPICMNQFYRLTFQPTGRYTLGFQEVINNVAKRQIEVFTAGCPVCEPAVALVNEMTCPDCEVTIHNLRESGAEQAAHYGVRTIPAVVVDGTVLLAATLPITREALAQAGVGQRL